MQIGWNPAARAARAGGAVSARRGFPPASSVSAKFSARARASAGRARLRPRPPARAAPPLTRPRPRGGCGGAPTPGATRRARAPDDAPGDCALRRGRAHPNRLARAASRPANTYSRRHAAAAAARPARCWRCARARGLRQGWAGSEGCCGFWFGWRSQSPLLVCCRCRTCLGRAGGRRVPGAAARVGPGEVRRACECAAPAGVGAQAGGPWRAMRQRRLAAVARACRVLRRPPRRAPAHASRHN